MLEGIWGDFGVCIGEMKGKTSALAAVRRSGGCVGVLFQLFNWNRRLAKKKELLSPGIPIPSCSLSVFVCVCFYCFYTRGAFSLETLKMVSEG